MKVLFLIILDNFLRIGKIKIYFRTNLHYLLKFSMTFLKDCYKSQNVLRKIGNIFFNIRDE